MEAASTKLYTINGIATKTGVAPHTIRRWIKDGTYTNYRMSGNRVYIPYQLFVDFLLQGTDTKSCEARA